MKLIAIIPARTGSKRLPNKNFKKFFGKSIISYPLGECFASEIFDKIVISTDSEVKFKFSMDSKNSLAQIHKRPTVLCSDTATVDEVCLDVLEKYPDYDYLCCVYPTTYAVTWQDLCKSFDRIIKESSIWCASVSMLNMDIQPNKADNGGFYWTKVNNFIKNKKLVDDEARHSLYELPMVDINTIQDFAEAKIHALTLGERFK